MEPGQLGFRIQKLQRLKTPITDGNIQTSDILVIGAGASGLFFAGLAARRGRRVAILDHNPSPGQKLLATGGGRCNFTNLHAKPEDYVSGNPHFCRSALSRFTPVDFTHLIQTAGIPYHDKQDGQLFCDRSSRDILDLLMGPCHEGNVTFHLGEKIRHVDRSDGFLIQTDSKSYLASRLVIATGGLSYPTLGASDLGYQVAKQFGHRIVETRPALDGFQAEGSDLSFFRSLAGVSLVADLRVGKHDLHGSLLFTHQGLSGPVALDASLYWEPGMSVKIDFLPRHRPETLLDLFNKARVDHPHSSPASALSGLLPKRFIKEFHERFGFKGKLADLSNPKMKDFCALIKNYEFTPKGTIGYAKAEVTKGGVDTRKVSSKTMESALCPGLYFLGEVLDVTGPVGGYNLQWAWSSAYAAAQSV